MFSVKYWEDEDRRDMGISEDYGTIQRCCDAIDVANRLFKRDGYSAVEVSTLSGDTLIYHISASSDDNNDAPHIEDYRKNTIGCF